MSSLFRYTLQRRRKHIQIFDCTMVDYINTAEVKSK